MDQNGEEAWKRMGKNGQGRDCSYQEVFSTVSYAETLNLLPWCLYTSVPLCHMGNALVVTKWQSKTASTTADVTNPKEWLLQGSQAIQLTHLKLLLQPYLFCLIYLLRAPLQWGAHSLSLLLAVPSKVGPLSQWLLWLPSWEENPDWFPRGGGSGQTQLYTRW